MDNKESRGFGDTLEKFTKATGIDKLVKFVAGEDCGCDERKSKLNELFQYRWKVKCLDENQFKTLNDFFITNPKQIKPSDQRNLNVIHKEVFGFEEGTCDGCIRSMVNRLKTVYEEYQTKEEEIDLESLTLQELRILYPEIKSNSKTKFIEKLKA
jgi:tyrosine-protein phosphatase YwqE